MQHFGVAVEDFEELFRKAEAMGALDAARGHFLYITPVGEVQLYLRDPDGNNLEINWPDASTLPEEIRAQAVRREDQFPQSDQPARPDLHASRSHLGAVQLPETNVTSMAKPDEPAPKPSVPCRAGFSSRTESTSA